MKLQMQQNPGLETTTVHYIANNINKTHQFYTI